MDRYRPTEFVRGVKFSDIFSGLDRPGGLSV